MALITAARHMSRKSDVTHGMPADENREEMGKTYSFRGAKSHLLPIILLVFASTAQRADALSLLE
ncbi:hypothetical protein CN151_25325 [Sinorhizobium meliloti]|uniref:hypothetical protein n=1 Tax=Rhizobium meliloti TaxID=382 RepID=UPI0002A5707F|nr:hypothetical protein [Sinorhizobium meliloti]AGA09645.1 hypothetical protein C770_GR4pC0949 [Sinorhizobium meliloti GR4]RVI50609.1 hypothetical protein CN195_16560 [Sinorhizobium meliloti]RVK97407.1 hypothetical protein CN151_25325 [Sinorhizobium meliloti]RVM89437.1 hypothetical protein CN119_25640 [Sinorhizobium meliloti]RVN03458.1 hypothetical protein CN112_27305 [Sinorhizobium meliloti]